ncbi:TetR family transcriptional regulator [Nocardiopsis sp. RSe5-2]|uniref:TetR family transcriptional regulator n=1 Tax=Nocardiopsis endophytica TaxID=3018445 RepID=A0ABT4U3R3_9ACTN|nr:TetR family transcriptional regulator [Nocardiopsis endophytica]MDA2811589.1 TetR family transcriptional regulator [Nocardiopsis endophytica]
MSRTDRTVPPRPNPAPAWTATALRRRPAQRRSMERVERLLRACAAVLEEEGADAVTTTEVARRAEIPIGTVYQFFHDKDGLVRALAARNMELFTHRLSERLEASGGADWAGAALTAVDTYVDMRRTVPGFGVLDADPDPGHDPEACAPRPPSGRSGPGRRDDRVSGTLLAMGLTATGGPPDPETERRVRVAVEAADAVLSLAFRTDPGGDPALITECRELLRSYLGRPAEGTLAGTGS